MSELEKQIAEHNILQKEIEAYGLQIKNLRSGVRPLCPLCPVTALGTLLALCPICSSTQGMSTLVLQRAWEVAPGWFLKHIP